MARARFEWDPRKDRENQEKHGVRFAVAQLAFADSRRVIAEDASHSVREPRHYCFGRVAGGIITVRFTYRDDVIRIFGAGYWRKGKQIYEREVNRALEDIKEDPHIGKLLKEDLLNRFSYKIGVYRIIYMVREKDKIVEIVTAGHRSTVYN